MNLHRFHPLLLILLSSVCALAQDNLLEDPSFELTKDKDQFGLVFAKWGGWKYEGDCEFAVGRVAHSGRTSCLLKAGAAPKIRVAQLRDLEPGRYQVTAWVRGLEIGVGPGTRRPSSCSTASTCPCTRAELLAGRNSLMWAR
jgi:hypothetical protein